MRAWAVIGFCAFWFGAAVAAQPFKKPSVIRWGATTAQLQQQLAPLCSKLVTRPIDPPFLPDVKVRQLQIDCSGFQFRGKGRHTEFVIRDGRLVMVWLMVDAPEGAGIIADMKKALGQPTGVNSNYVAFEKHRIAWRHKPAEILFYAPELDADMRPDFR
jgi:hypothetical protein